METKDMLKMNTWAVVGANENPDKFGNKIYKKLKSSGYRVYPVNPNYDAIDGEKCYHTLSEIPEKPDVIDMVVPPKVGAGVIQEAAGLGIKNIWLQPGTYDDQLLQAISQKGLNQVQACVLTELR